MTVDEYIAKVWTEDRLNEYSYYSGWHEAILDIIREVWQSAQQGVAAELLPRCGKADNVNDAGIKNMTSYTGPQSA